MNENKHTILLAGGIALAIIGVCLVLAIMYLIAPKEHRNSGMTVSTSLDETITLLNGEYFLPGVGKEEVKAFAATLYYKEHSKEALDGFKSSVICQSKLREIQQCSELT